MNSGGFAPERRWEMNEAQKFLIDKKLNDRVISHEHADTVYVSDAMALFKAEKDAGAKLACSDGLCCRVRSEGETMRSGDIVLMDDTFMPLGFHTEFYHYFAGLKVVDGMKGRIICKTT